MNICSGESIVPTSQWRLPSSRIAIRLSCKGFTKVVFERSRKTIMFAATIAPSKVAVSSSLPISFSFSLTSSTRFSLSEAKRSAAISGDRSSS